MFNLSYCPLKDLNSRSNKLIEKLYKEQPYETIEVLENGDVKEKETDKSVSYVFNWNPSFWYDCIFHCMIIERNITIQRNENFPTHKFIMKFGDNLINSVIWSLRPVVD